jgi:pyruvate carboxylase
VTGADVTTGRPRSAVTAICRLGIVNRGEPAMRVLTAVTELNRDGGAAGAGGHITTVAFYTDPDTEAWFVREADEAVRLGPATYLDPRDGHRKSAYLDEEAVVDALVVNREMTGRAGNRTPALPVDRVLEELRSRNVLG